MEPVPSDSFVDKTPTSRSLYERAVRVLPSGVTHDTRYLQPHPIFVERAQGSRKWDVDGNEYVDYFGGHGALMLGHNHPVVTEAVREQLERGTHYGASHELELEWAELVVRMVPCAEKVRFTSSGTEATMLALRIARAYTERRKILRFDSHFHGWHDQVAFGSPATSADELPSGITRGMAENIALCPPNDMDAAEALLDSGEIAAVIFEPTGATFGRVPTADGVPHKLRQLTARTGTLLIFDEVITGFRVARGGAQEVYGVTPDLAVMAKSMAGGFPGGAVVGRADVMDMLTMKDAQWNARRRIAHQGTFNANPISAAAGLAQLKMIAEGDVIEHANANGEQLRRLLAEVSAEEGSNAVVYGTYSGFHFFCDDEDRVVTCEAIYNGEVPYGVLKGGIPGALISDFRAGMLAAGVDLVPWPGGLISAVHTDEDLEQTAAAFRQVLRQLEKAAPVTA